MKLRGRIIISIIGIIILACGTFFLPQIIHHYYDEHYMKQVNFLEDESIEVFKYSDELTMDEKIDILGSVSDGGDEVLEVPYRLTDKQKSEFEKIAIKEVERWFITGEIGISANMRADTIEKLELTGFQMFKVYDAIEKDRSVTILAVTLSLKESKSQNTITVYLDHQTHKAYLMVMERLLSGVWNWVESQKEENEIKGKETLAEELRRYYGINAKVGRTPDKEVECIVAGKQKNFWMAFYDGDEEWYRIAVGFQDLFWLGRKYGVSTSESYGE